MFNYFRTFIAIIFIAYLYYGDNGKDIKRRQAANVNKFSQCSQAKSGVLTFGFSEGVNAEAAKLGLQISGLVGAPGAIYFYIDQPDYYANDLGYSTQLVNNGHVIGLRWHRSWTETSNMTKEEFQNQLILSSTNINAQINLYASPKSTYFPKYILFDYTTPTDSNFLKYSDYASELGFVTISSNFYPESVASNITDVLNAYNSRFQAEALGVGTHLISIHPGNAAAILTSSNLDQLAAFFKAQSKTVISFMNCIYSTANHPKFRTSSYS